MKEIEIAKEKGDIKGEKRYHKDAIEKDRIIYDKVFHRIAKKEPVMNIHKKTGLSRNTIYTIKKICLF